MKITIDTKEDSHEEIEHALSLLKSLVGKKVYTNSPNIFDSDSNSVGSVVDDAPASEAAPEPASGNIFGNMFGDSSATSSADDPVSPLPTEPIEQPSMDDEEESDDHPEVITY
tara:strand:- start:192 stop:530 length:339 start_codon:yes stop_codon:yes gene_type:complete